MIKHLFLYFIFLTFLAACGSGDSKDKEQPAPTPAPVINSFTASKVTIMAGESIELTADYSGGTAIIDNKIGNISAGSPITISPEQNTTYTLTVTNAEGSAVTAQLSIEVMLPEIISFTASTMEITEGESVTLTAEFKNGLGRIDVGVGNIASGGSKTVKPNTPTTYTLTVENSEGFQINTSITIDIVRLRIVSIIQPTEEISVHDDTFIAVNIISNDGLARVTAEVADRNESILVYGRSSDANNIDRVTGSLSVAGLADGEYTLTITARDYKARTTSLEKRIKIDNVPVLTVNNPQQFDLVNSILPLDISCEEPNGDCQIYVKHQGTVLATATNHLYESINLSDYVSQNITLTIEGSNRDEQVASTEFSTYVVDSAINITLIQKFSSTIIDFDGQRALLHNSDLTLNKQLQIATIINDETTAIEFDSNHAIAADKSMLTPTGVIFTASNAITYDFNNNELLTLGETSIVNTQGDFAVYCVNNNLLRRTLSTRIDTVLGTNYYCNQLDVSNTGTVIGKKSENIVRYKNGEDTLLDLLSLDSVDIEAYPASISGNFIVYYRGAPAFRWEQFVLFDDSNDIIILEGARTYTGGEYNGTQINNDWLAYSNGTNIFTRDADGNILQRTYFNEISYIHTLADSGELVFINEDKRYLSKPNGDVILLGPSNLGTIYYENSKWFIAIENRLYELTVN